MKMTMISEIFPVAETASQAISNIGIAFAIAAVLIAIIVLIIVRA